MAGFSTRAIKAATTAPQVNQVPSSVPIYQAAAFSTADAAELGDVLTGAVPGYAYSRIDNPTTAVLGDAVAELEGAEAGLAFATGMAAIHAAIVSVVRAGQTIVATKAVYGTTRDLLVRVLSGLGIATEFVDPRDFKAVDAALARTGAPVLYVETISNPTIVVSDLAALAALAHRHDALLLVDNTFASPYACRPIERGADLVMHSATKYLSGHGDVLAGVVVGSRERIAAIRPILVDVGGALAPLAAFLVLRGLPTLAIRMERHTQTATELAAWLAGQDGVDRVHYPGLPGDPSHSVAVRQLDVFGGMLAFELAGGREAGRAFLDAMVLAERTASLGAVRTITAHPPSTTHRQLDEDALREAGIAPGLLRCSVGLEDVEDLRADMELGLAAARSAAAATPD
ncbi:MAG: aminotransferase class I/II-fold pyridoxal phosphate-dependent enzyme [Candidatus Limnocylindrales bacterium]|jgi:cystathionine beta-lyase/cystathionine gamma-synthase